ncbi:hypothetical protein Q2T40_03760 [Winogradskyella maritima]|nr:hypothetical protein [Winogradskyella maritima]
MSNIKFGLKEKDYRPAFVFDDVQELNMASIQLTDTGKEEIVLKDTEQWQLDAHAQNG